MIMEETFGHSSDKEYHIEWIKIEQMEHSEDERHCTSLSG